MNKNALQHVTYEQAKRLKVAKFDWPVMNYYDEIENGEKTLQSWGYNWDANKSDFKGLFSAPTVALVLKWIRDVKRIGNTIDYKWRNGNQFIYKWVFTSGINCLESEAFYNTYEAAEYALLEELLNIIETEK